MYYEEFDEDGGYLGRKYVTKKEYENGAANGVGELILEPGDRGYEDGQEYEAEIEEIKAGREEEERLVEREKDEIRKKEEEELMESEKGNDDPMRHCYIDKQGFMVYFEGAFAYATDHDLHFRG